MLKSYGFQEFYAVNQFTFEVFLYKDEQLTLSRCELQCGTIRDKLILYFTYDVLLLFQVFKALKEKLEVPERKVGFWIVFGHTLAMCPFDCAHCFNTFCSKTVVISCWNGSVIEQLNQGVKHPDTFGVVHSRFNP